MALRLLGFLVLSLAVSGPEAGAQEDLSPLLQRRWFEARGSHFNAYSCGETQRVSRLIGRLEQFRLAYSLLAGAQAVASPPIVVLAFPDAATMRPFLPQRQGKPANLTAFFHRGSDENLIVLPLTDSVSLQAILHEYAHLLFRHNDPFWPLWLKEGMAEIYGTLEATGAHNLRIGRPLTNHVHLLDQGSLLPLANLFAVTHDSPDYNESERQGVFYAESWLLAHYLMVGDNGAHRPAFSQLTAFLRQGQSPEQAFTNALRSTLPATEKELQGYLARGKFGVLDLPVSVDLTTPQSFAVRALAPVEVCFRLGDELLRIQRPEAAAAYFRQAQMIAPASPLPFEGLGLLAADGDRPEEAAQLLGEALKHGSVSFLAHYTYAAQKFRLASGSADHFVTVKGEEADEIRTELDDSLALMPDFSRAHHLLGIFELVQGANPASAEKHLLRAFQLEPENLSFVLSLAEAQMLKPDFASARSSLDLLRRPYVNSRLRLHAQELLAEIGRRSDSSGANK